MSLDWFNPSPRVAGTLLFLLTSTGWVGRSQAQNRTADPYKPFNQQYEQFVYPTFPTGYGLTPNQGVLEGRGGYGGANQFQRYMEIETEVEDALGQTRRRSGPGVPYYSAYRQYDREYDRIYRANRKSDESFYEDKNARHEKYLAYLKERDPQKRAQLYREYLNDSRKVSRDLASRRNQPSQAAAAKRARRPGTGQQPATGRLRGNPRALEGGGGAPSAVKEREKKPSEILRESEELVRPRTTPRTFTAPGLAPRSGSSSAPRD